jgi:hypothetical protein
MKTIMGIASILAVFLSSCSHYYYVANVQNVPLFKEKNETQLSGSYGGGDESVSIDIQTAYSITDKIAVMANFMHATGGDQSYKNYGKGNYFEGAIGYFKPVGQYGVFQIYGGLGGCGQHHEYSSIYYNEYEGSSDLSYIRYFVQPSIGITFKALDIAFSTRFCDVYYNKIENNVSGSYYHYNDLYSLLYSNHFNLEPAFTIRGGWKNIKLQVQAEYAGLINNQELYFGEEWHLSIGINFLIAKRYK